MRRTTHFRGDAVLPSVRQSVSPAIRQSCNPSFCQIIANCSPWLGDERDSILRPSHTSIKIHITSGESVATILRFILFAAFLFAMSVTAEAQRPALVYDQAASYARGVSGITCPSPNWYCSTQWESISPSCRVGRSNSPVLYHDYRMLLQWDFPESLGEGAFIRKATLSFTYSTDCGKTITLSFQKLSYQSGNANPYDAMMDIVFERETKIDRVGESPPILFHFYTNTLTGSNGIYEYRVHYYNGVMQNSTELITQLQLTCNADDRYFHLGFDPENAHPDNSWYINPANVRLRIEYDPAPSTLVEDITITNVVDGVEHYDLEPGSRVRGDLNLFLTNGWDADYSQMPPFEPPYATRSWWTEYKHIAETWFSKFEDQSLSGRHKHKFWNSDLNHYSVVHLTDHFTEDMTEFKAHTAQAYPARHFAKRELQYNYDGLPIEYKDPWRVQQDLNAGGPDSTQMSMNYHVDQVTPYEPWDDPQSWGVFVDIDKDLDPHYSARYWKYYEYDAGTDSYTKKNELPLAEGDLINMDVILPGAGALIAPSGSIEIATGEMASDPYKDYKLEYKSQSATMDFTGVYKAHLLSDKEAQPTRSANQRKLDISEIDVYTRIYHLVYESGGEVWYTQSSDAGDTWSPEELVSSYLHLASNPSLCALNGDVYVVFMEDGIVRLKQRHEGGWYDHPLTDDWWNNGGATTPVVAAGLFCADPDGIARDHVIAVLWDHNENIRYNILRLDGTTLVHDQMYGDQQESGVIATNTSNYPVFPTIVNDHDFIYFSACWREGDDIRCARLEIASCNPAAFDLYPVLRPDATNPYEKAVFAPCITHNADNKPVVAYEVKVPSIIYSDRWVNVKTFDFSSQVWDATVYQMPYYQFTGYNDPIAPSVGAHAASGVPGLRIAFHQNWGGGIRVGVVDAQYTEYTQLNNGESFPSVVPYASNAALREAYSFPYPTSPFQHAIRTTNSNLTKVAASNIRMVRDLRVLTGDDVAILGITDLTYVGQDASRNDIEWFPLSDTLVIGHDLQAHELLRSGVFTPASGASLEYSGMVYCSEPTAMPVGVSLSAQVRRVSDNAVLLNQSLALRNIPADTAIWHAWTRNLSQLPSVPVYLSLGVDGTLPNGVTIGTSKVYLEDQYIPKLAAREEVLPNGVADFELGQNHPNPFNPTTTIPFTLNREQQVRLVVYDQLGREIAVLADGVLSGGSHERVFDAAQLPAGVYHYQLTGSSATETRTLTLLK
jgi:hypothetical protein